MAGCDARLDGLDHADVAALFCMSPGLVNRYTHHIGKEAEARKTRSRMERRVQTALPGDEARRRKLLICLAAAGRIC